MMNRAQNKEEAAKIKIPRSVGLDLVAAERKRHIEVEGWTPEHDAEHRDEELATAAACYALPHYLRPFPVREDSQIPILWPWDRQSWKPGTDRVRELVKAGALIVAEIDRLVASQSNTV